MLADMFCEMVLHTQHIYCTISRISDVPTPSRNMCDRQAPCRPRARSLVARCLGRAADLRERGSRFSRSPYEMAAYFPGFTVGLTSCSRSQHDLNFTVGYDGRHASYSISSDFRGYKELDNFDDDDAEEADAADAGTAADDGADYDE